MPLFALAGKKYSKQCFWDFQEAIFKKEYEKKNRGWMEKNLICAAAWPVP